VLAPLATLALAANLSLTLAPLPLVKTAPLAAALPPASLALAPLATLVLVVNLSSTLAAPLLA